MINIMNQKNVLMIDPAKDVLISCLNVKFSSYDMYVNTPIQNIANNPLINIIFFMYSYSMLPSLFLGNTVTEKKNNDVMFISIQQTLREIETPIISTKLLSNISYLKMYNCKKLNEKIPKKIINEFF
jgi:hypothetical protein